MCRKKPKPIIQERKPKLCPVCGNPSYSAAGVHPQCSVKKADQKRAAKIKQKAEATAKTATPKKRKSNTTRWQKTCPQCRTSLHARRKACDCGHTFQDDK